MRAASCHKGEIAGRQSFPLMDRYNLFKYSKPSLKYSLLNYFVISTDEAALAMFTRIGGERFTLNFSLFCISLALILCFLRYLLLYYIRNVFIFTFAQAREEGAER